MVRHQSGRCRLAALAAVLGLTVLAAGCGQPHQPAGRGPQVLVGHLERPSPGTVSPKQVAAADVAFGRALFGQACPSMPTSNLLLSPESAAEALGMLYAGAAGQTASAVGRLLRLPTWSPALVAALERHTDALTRAPQLEVSNHLFEQAGVMPAQRVLNDLRTAYNSDLLLVEFGDEPAATAEINAVVAHDTHGLVPALFGAPLAQSTRTVLTNAVFLNARWVYPFPAIAPAQFRTAAGDLVQVPLMDSTAAIAGYHQAGGWQSATLPYTGGDLAAVAVLPPPRATDCALPTAAQWAALTAGNATQSAEVRMPRLHLSHAWDNLQTTLAAMGLPLNGDYSGLGAGDSQISEIAQKDTMDVSQLGTTAAAATGIAVGTSAAAGKTVILTFNRPFLLILEDTATHSPLFLARITNPAQN